LHNWLLNGAISAKQFGASPKYGIETLWSAGVVNMRRADFTGLQTISANDTQEVPETNSACQ
jgi:hypothetical protein